MRQHSPLPMATNLQRQTFLSGKLSRWDQPLEAEQLQKAAPQTLGVAKLKLGTLQLICALAYTVGTSGSPTKPSELPLNPLFDQCFAPSPPTPSAATAHRLRRAIYARI